ncbi:barstar family protein [Uniformispora flossi]|uniref:barstar family protein n=1 Tax=Uniformispora flossi TaxID=3390723 RepID=UPI003C2E2D86
MSPWRDVNAWHELRNATAWTSGLLPPDLADVHDAAPVDVLTASARTHGWSSTVVDLRDARDKAGAMDAFAAGLSLPAYFGRNWDALWDCLTDDTLLPEPARRVIVVDRWRTFADRNTDDWDRIRELLRDAAEYWAGTRTPMVVLVRW